ncbi:MAG: lysylphosphatidylglycerol synthase transmembrane domain-containing protein [Candidatus Omnitrophica bacterium]|nr:lysylphosphatidylglycerol synthase transmembrane domain-containing protein [Candidatus Omnitrophota bacterium]
MAIIKKIISIFLRISISIILLIFLFRQVDEKSLFTVIKNANKPLLFLACCVFFLSYLFCLLRWQMLLKAADIHLPLKRIIISFSGGIFFNLFLPSTIGGDFMRTIDLATHTKKPKEVVATVFLDRLSGYVGLVILALVALCFGWKLIEDKVILLSVTVITGLLIVILMVLFNNFLFRKINRFMGKSGAGKIREALKNVHHEIHIFRHQKKVLLKNIFLSLLVQIVSPVSFYFIALSLGVRIEFLYFLIFLPIIGAITLLPISIGGLGLRDASTIYFFAKVGMTKDFAFAMSLISFSFIVFYGAIGGLIYVFTVRHRRIQSLKSPAAI